jgi:glycosyltransferase involved in cell wall biosynthesis
MSLRILYHHRTRAMDGQAVHVRELIGAFASLGHEVREVALVPRGANGSGGPAGGPAVDEAAPFREATSVWRRLELPRFAREVAEHLYTPWGERMILRAARGFRPDLVYERYAMSCAAGVRAAHRLSVPCFLEVNSPMCLEMERLGLLRFGRWARRTERSILARADRVFTVSRVLKDLLVRDGLPAERVVVCHNGASPELFAGAREKAARAGAGVRPPGGIVLGFVGFPRAWHRLDLCLAAMGLLRARGRADLHLVVVGDGPARASLEAAAAAHGLGDRVRFTGVVARDEVPAWVGAFDIAVIPAMNEYASPLKLFDSMAAGVPTVAPDQANLREVVDHGAEALLFRPGDAEALAGTIGLLAGDPSLRAAMGERARRRIVADDRTWRANARAVVEELAAMRAVR